MSSTPSSQPARRTLSAWPPAGQVRARAGLPLAFIAVLACASVGRGADSLAVHVPADVRLFVELESAPDLLLPLLDPEAWLTLTELLGQPARREDADRWARQVQETLQMPPDEALRTLFGRRVALVGTGLQPDEEAVVLCRPAGDPAELLRRWPVRPLPSTGQTSIFRLHSSLRVASFGPLLLLADDAAGRTFDRLLTQLETNAAPALANDPVYRRLLARVPADPSGVLFARLIAPPAWPGLPTLALASPRLAALAPLLGNSTSVLCALHREDRLVHLTVVGDAPGSAVARIAALRPLVERLPERTLAAWAGHVPYRDLDGLVASLPEQNLVRVAVEMQNKVGTLRALTDVLSTATCAAVGTVLPAGRPAGGPPAPALAVLINTTDPAAAAREWTALLHSTVALYKLLALRLGNRPPTLSFEPVPVGELTGEQLDLTGLLSDGPRAVLGELHLSWVVEGDALIIASHTHWLREIVAARRGAAPTLETTLERTPRPPTGRRDTIIVVHSGPLADLGSLWLAHLERVAPATLSEDWWRNYQPGGPQVRLGAQVTADGEARRLTVRAVLPGSPADGVLRPGDEIIGVNRLRFATTQPIAEFTRGLVARENPRWVDLIVERDRVVRVRRVPLPFVDPVQVLRRVVAIGRIVQRAVYHDDAPDVDGPRASLTLELRAGAPPLFPFEIQPPESQPAAPGPAPAPPPTTAFAPADQPSSQPADPGHPPAPAPTDSAPAPPPATNPPETAPAPPAAGG